MFSHGQSNDAENEDEKRCGYLKWCTFREWKWKSMYKYVFRNMHTWHVFFFWCFFFIWFAITCSHFFRRKTHFTSHHWKKRWENVFSLFEAWWKLVYSIVNVSAWSSINGNVKWVNYSVNVWGKWCEMWHANNANRWKRKPKKNQVRILRKKKES